VTIAAAEAGMAVLLEKPFAHTTSAARRIMKAVERYNVRLMVGHILRFDPRYVQTFHAAAPERLGEPIHLRAKRNGVRSTAKRLGGSTSILTLAIKQRRFNESARIPACEQHARDSDCSCQRADSNLISRALRRQGQRRAHTSPP
jgi:hypothetical protein